MIEHAAVLRGSTPRTIIVACLTSGGTDRCQAPLNHQYALFQRSASRETNWASAVSVTGQKKAAAHQLILCVEISSKSKAHRAGAPILMACLITVTTAYSRRPSATYCAATDRVENAAVHYRADSLRHRQKMIGSNLSRRVSALYQLAVELASLPVANLRFLVHYSPEHVRSVYRNFTKPHPKYWIIRNKTIGAALIDLRAFASPPDFIESLRSCGRAGAERRRAIARGHRLRLIDRNCFADAIHNINTSLSERQGRPMAASYVEKQHDYKDLAHFRYYGVFDKNEQLVAYCNIGIFGNFAVIDQILGLRTPDGVMYFLITEITSELITEHTLDYLMYDTFFGALPGLRDFKQRAGFRPYRVRYAIA